MVVIAYYDTLTLAAAAAISTSVTDVVTLGYRVKNDGGGGHYKRYDSPLPYRPYLAFEDANTGLPGGSPTGHWGFIPDNGTVSLLQAGAYGDADTAATPHDDRAAIQACIDFIDRWNTRTASDPLGFDCDRRAIKLIIPANRTFLVDTTGSPDAGLKLKGPITIEGEDRGTSRLYLKDIGTNQDHLMLAKGINRITLRNFTMQGSYAKGVPDGLSQLLVLKNTDDVLLENMTFTLNRAVVIGGDTVRNLTIRRCLLSESRRGGVVIDDVQGVTIENNDFYWIPDDPVALTVSDLTVIPPPAPLAPSYFNEGGMIRITGNRCFGCRGLNVVGAKNVIISENFHVLGRGRAIHIGVTTTQNHGDASMLNVIVSRNVIVDLLDAGVDPRFPEDRAGGHRAIDIEMLYVGGGSAGANTPGWPRPNVAISDPTQYYYASNQGMQGGVVWRPGGNYDLPSPPPPPPPPPWQMWWDGNIYTTALGGTSGSIPPTGTGTVSDGTVTWTYVGHQNPTPYSGNIVIEGNIIARTRPPAVAASDPDHVGFYDSFDSYQVGPYGGTSGYTGVQISLDDITPREGIGVSGYVRNLVIRSNHVRNCDVGIVLEGRHVPRPFSLLDVTIIDNDLFDWKTAGILVTDYATYAVPDAVPPVPSVPQPQRLSILNNRADGDPYHWNQVGTVRKASGKWADTGLGAFVDVTGIGHVMIAGNHVRNVARLVAALDETLHTMQGNVGYCDPNGLGYQPGNIGIGNLIKPQLGWRYIIEGGDPGASDYAVVKNTCPLAASGMPTSGKWVQGTLVANLTFGTTTNPPPAGSTEVTGWRRMTTGPNNVLHTDWRLQTVGIV